MQRVDIGVSLVGKMVRICRGASIVEVAREAAAPYVQVAVAMARAANKGGTVYLRDPAGAIREY